MRRILELDVLRGIAALSVVMFHFTTVYHNRYEHPEEPIISIPLGYYGVQLFFMISGFVIFLTLSKTENYKDFLVSRFSRLYPVYWVSVLITFFTIQTFGLKGVDLDLSEAVINLTMLQGVFGISNVDGAYWSLMYELIFYVFMLAIFQFRLLKRIELILTIWLIVQLSSVLIEIYFGWFPWKITKLLILEYANLFVSGIIYYSIFIDRFTRQRAFILLLCLINQLLVDGLTGLIIVSFYFMIFTLFCYNKISFIVFKPLIYLGSISYSLYLTHQYLGYMLLNHLYEIGASTDISILITLVASLLLASLLRFTIEKPALSKIRLWHKKSKRK